jgi:hypothetical protein
MFNQKKGISAMIGYVLLIVIAVGLSAAVYSYLKIYIPKDKPECPDDINIIMQSYACQNGILNITLANKGLFKVNAAYIRLGPRDKKVKEWINNPKLEEIEEADFNINLMPSSSITKIFSPGLISNGGDFGLEIEPAVYVDGNQLALCEKAVITQSITCS